jgi:prepilin-type N-terminal cleavage/methylation domain-containing protein
MRRARAFTLVEILIVVVLLGVLAAIVVPTLAGYGGTARQTTLAMNLSLLRRFIPVYTSQHLETPPGYPNGDTSAAPTEAAFVDQATLSSNKEGQTAPPGTLGFLLGPYISKVPPNPFNKLATVGFVADGDSFPAVADGNFGYLYKPATGEIRADNVEVDTRGIPYYEY